MVCEKKFTIYSNYGDIERGGLFARNLLKPICFISPGNGSCNISIHGEEKEGQIEHLSKKGTYGK
jgi:hypothetical protein